MANSNSSFDDTVAAVKSAQAKWADAIVARNPEGVAKLYANSGLNWHHDLHPGAEKCPKPDECPIAFNPTLDDNFLTTQAETLNYFKGTNDKPGFAMKGWTRDIFDPRKHPKAQRYIAPTDDGAVAIGRYLFEREDITLDSEGERVLAVVRIVADYTFVYKYINRELMITGHHSSLPVKLASVK